MFDIQVDLLLQYCQNDILSILDNLYKWTWCMLMLAKSLITSNTCVIKCAIFSYLPIDCLGCETFNWVISIESKCRVDL